jgi:hypothetical protein
MNSRILKLAEKFRVKLGKSGYRDIVHIARQADNLYKGVGHLLPGVVDNDLYEPVDNSNLVKNIVGQLRVVSFAMAKDAKQFGLSAEVAASYKAKLVGLLAKLVGLVVDKKYLVMLKPLNLSLANFEPVAVPRKKPKMVWHPIAEGEPEDPEEEEEVPLPPGLGLGRTCPPGTPQRVCDLGYWPIGYDARQHKIEQSEKKKG